MLPINPEESGSGHVMLYSKYSSLVVSNLKESGSGDLAAGRSLRPNLSRAPKTPRFPKALHALEVVGMALHGYDQ